MGVAANCLVSHHCPSLMVSSAVDQIVRLAIDMNMGGGGPLQFFQWGILSGLGATAPQLRVVRIRGNDANFDTCQQ